MKIGGCVVLYNPTMETVKNIYTYIDFVECLVVVDNSTKYSLVQDELKKNNKVVYINQNGNSGIAKALNVGLCYLNEKGYDIALTMDQDSKFPYNDALKIISFVRRHISKYAILSLRYKNDKNTYLKPKRIIDVNFWITSGNFVKLSDFIEVGGFREDLFIDSVDHEFCHKLILHKKRIGVMRDFCLKHTIGNPGRVIHMFGTYFPLSSNHSSIRYYYRYRNLYYLYHKDKKFYLKIYLKEFYINIPRIVLFDSDRMTKVKAIKRGIHDGKLGNLGPYHS